MEIQIDGKSVRVAAADIGKWTVVVTGTWPRCATFKDEQLLTAEAIKDPERVLEGLRRSGLRADLFSFAQKVPEITPKYHYYFEWENWATIRLTTFEDWWSRLPQESRKNVRRSTKRGVTVRVVPFDDDLVVGIQAIFNETPIRQGRRFWHFGKDCTTIRRELGTCLDRSEFVGAYLNGELIGFVKVTYVDSVATIMQIVAKDAHRDARPINALLAKTVEICHKNRMSFLIYGRYIYGHHKGSLLTEFKRRNGFEEILVPRYFVPLTKQGALAIKFRVHAGLKLRDRLPSRLVAMLLNLRSWWYRLRAVQTR